MSDLPPGLTAQRVIVPSRSRTALYVTDANDSPPSQRRVVFQVSVPDCKTYVCGLCIFAPGTKNQYGNLVCFDVSGVTQDVTIVIPDVPEIILGDCTIYSVITLGPVGGANRDGCFDANSVGEVLAVAANRGLSSYTVKVFPGTYTTSVTEISAYNFSFIGQTCDCEEVVFQMTSDNTPAGYFLYLNGVSTCFENVTLSTAVASQNNLLNQMLLCDGGVLADGNSIVMRNVCVRGTCGFDEGAADTVAMILVQDFAKVCFESVYFEVTDAFSNIARIPTVGLNIRRCPDVQVLDCHVLTKSSLFLTKSFALKVLTASNNGDTSISIRGCQFNRANSNSLLDLSVSSTPCSVAVESCEFNGASLVSNCVSINLNDPVVDSSFVSKAVALSDCEFTGALDDSFFVSGLRGSTVTVDGMVIDKNNPRPLTGGVEVAFQGVCQPSNLLTSDAQFSHMGYLPGGNMAASLEFPNVAPVAIFVFDDSSGTFSSNLALEGTLGNGIDVWEDNGDILWVGFDVDNVYGLRYEASGAPASLTGSMSLGAVFVVPETVSARFVTDFMIAPGQTGQMSYDQPVLGIDSETVFAMAEGSIPSGGVVNGFSAASWVAIRRDTGVAANSTILRHIRGVGQSTCFSQRRAPLLLAKSQVSTVSVPVSPFGTGALPTVSTAFLGDYTGVSGILLSGGFVGGTIQGASGMVTLDSQIVVREEMYVRAVVAVLGALSTTASLRLTMSLLQSPVSANLVDLSPGILADPVLTFVSSGPSYVPVPGAAGTIQTVEFPIPLASFSNLGVFPLRPPFTALITIDRDVSLDTDVAVNLSVLSVSLSYSHY